MYYTIVLHCVAAFSFLANALCIWLIVKKTDPRSRKYRLGLVLLQVSTLIKPIVNKIQLCSLSNDVYVSLLYVPCPVLPTLIVYCRGLLCFEPVNPHILLVSILMFSSSNYLSACHDVHHHTDVWSQCELSATKTSGYFER